MNLRDLVAAILRAKGYEHDDATDPDDMHWYGPRLGVRPMLACLAYEMNCELPGGKTPGWNTYEVSVAAPLPSYG